MSMNLSYACCLILPSKGSIKYNGTSFSARALELFGLVSWLVGRLVVVVFHCFLFSSIVSPENGGAVLLGGSSISVQTAATIG